jgi:hypothetical protein
VESVSLRKVSLRPLKAGFAQALAEASAVILIALTLTVPVRAVGAVGLGRHYPP